MEKYKYLIATSDKGCKVFVILAPTSTLSHGMLAKKLNLTEIISQGELNSTEPAFTLPESDVLGREVIAGLSQDCFFTGEILQFGVGHSILINIECGDEHTFERVISNLSSAIPEESGFKFGQAE